MEQALTAQRLRIPYMANKTVGRRRGEGVGFSKGIEVKVTEKMFNDIFMATDNLSEWGRNAFHAALSQSDQLTQPLRYIGSVTGGSWREALENAGAFLITSDTKDELQASSTDYFFRISGDSMRCAGLLDGALALVKPLSEKATARRGEIAVLQITFEDGQAESTVKRISKVLPNGSYELETGEGENYPVPENAQTIRAVGIVTGVISRVG